MCLRRMLREMMEARSGGGSREVGFHMSSAHGRRSKTSQRAADSESDEADSGPPIPAIESQCFIDNSCHGVTQCRLACHSGHV